MGFDVEKTFDFCEWTVDYVKKKRTINYPHRQSAIVNHFNFFSLAFTQGFVSLIVFSGIYFVFALGAGIDGELTAIIYLFGGIVSVLGTIIFYIVYYVVVPERAHLLWLKFAARTMDERVVELFTKDVGLVTNILHIGNDYNEYVATKDFARQLISVSVKAFYFKNRIDRPVAQWYMILRFKKLPKNGFFRLLTKNPDTEVRSKPIVLLGDLVVDK